MLLSTDAAPNDPALERIIQLLQSMESQLARNAKEGLVLVALD